MKISTLGHYVFDDNSIKVSTVRLTDNDDMPDRFKQFARSSTSFTQLNMDFYIDTRPCYDLSAQKIIDAVEYFQFQVSEQLRNDIINYIKNIKFIEVIVADSLPDGYFYSERFPFIEWTILKEGIDRKIMGIIWLSIKR